MLLKLVNTIIVNTKGEGAQATEDFWVKAEKLYYSKDGEHGLKKWVSVSEALAHLPDPDEPKRIWYCKTH